MKLVSGRSTALVDGRREQRSAWREIFAQLVDLGNVMEVTDQMRVPLRLELPSGEDRRDIATPLSGAHQALSGDPGPELSIIVPTLNERENVAEVIRRLEQCLAGRSWEVIFVDDDSPDGTSDLVREIAQRDRRVRCIQRIGRRGLSSACIEGMLASAAPYLAVIDGDLQHDEKLLGAMLDSVKEEGIDVVIGSRYVNGGGVGDWDRVRARMSRTATRLSQLAFKADLQDPMSGFFVIRRNAFAPVVRNLSGIGFKILLDLFASSPHPLRFKELPYQFRSREFGESKLDSRATWDFVMLLLDKLIGHLVPIRFISFALVGSVGVLFHLVMLTLLFKGMQFGFIESHAISTVVAMVVNFTLNNIFTHSDARLKGWRWLQGCAVFILACSVGAIANIAISTYLFERDTAWTLSAMAGIMIGAVWNFATTTVYTWDKYRRVA